MWYVAWRGSSELQWKKGQLWSTPDGGTSRNSTELQSKKISWLFSKHAPLRLPPQTLGAGVLRKTLISTWTVRGPATIPVRATLPWSAEGTWASRPMRSVSGVVCGKGLGGCRMPCVEQLVCYWTVHPQDHTCPSEMPATTQTTVRTPVYMFFIYFFFLRL